MKEKKFEFTEEQKEYIIDNWGKVSVHSMKNKFGCSWYAVANVAKENNLELPKSNDWTEEDIEKLKSLASTLHYEDIAIQMGRTPNAVYLKAKRLNITIIQDRREWTAEEEDYLIERWGRDKIEKIAKNMQRSIYSIKVKATRMGLGYMSQNNIEQISFADISRAIGVSRDRLTRWMNFGLKVKKKKVTNKYSYYCVDLDDLMDFLEKHQDWWDSNKLEKNTFGLEPDWLKEKRQRDLVNPPLEYRVWSEEEIRIASDLLLQGYNYDYIAPIINRTPQAVAIKMREIGLEYRLSRFWKGHELKYLQENYGKITVSEIAEVLNRTPKSIMSKAEELNLQYTHLTRIRRKKHE